MLSTTYLGATINHCIYLSVVYNLFGGNNQLTIDHLMIRPLSTFWISELVWYSDPHYIWELNYSLFSFQHCGCWYRWLDLWEERQVSSSFVWSCGLQDLGFWRTDRVLCYTSVFSLETKSLPGKQVLCILTSKCMLSHAIAWTKNIKKCSEIIKNILFSSCVREAHVRLT